MTELPELLFRWVAVNPCLVDLETHASLVRYVYPKENKPELLAELKSKLIMEQTMLEAIMKMPALELRQQALEALQRAVFTWRVYTGMQKAEAIRDRTIGLLRQVPDAKLVIFVNQVDLIAYLKPIFKKEKLCPITLFARTPYEKRCSHLRRFRNNPHNRVLITMISATMFEMDLTAANHIFFGEYSNDIAVNAQAVLRCHNMHQKRPVTVKFFNIRNSVDSEITHMIREQTTELVGGKGPWVEKHLRPIRKVRPGP